MPSCRNASRARETILSSFARPGVPSSFLYLRLGTGFESTGHGLSMLIRSTNWSILSSYRWLLLLAVGALTLAKVTTTWPVFACSLGFTICSKIAIYPYLHVSTDLKITACIET